jgi:outer membrane receptor for ferrienterochelin and colicins
LNNIYASGYRYISRVSATAMREAGEHWRAGIESSMIAGQADQNYNAKKSYFILAAMIRYNIWKLSFVLNGEDLTDVRQNKQERIFDRTISSPVFHKLWAPIDGRVIKLSIKWKL